MKKITILALFIFSGLSQAFSQVQYEVLPDNEEGKFFKGIISRQILVTDTSMAKWYSENVKSYTPNADGLNAVNNYRDSVELLVFMGTWCHDSHFIIPKLYSFLDAAGFDENRITLIATDRNKKTVSHLSEALGVTLVPTIIVMKKGKELGRIVEYGKYGMFDKELGEVIAAGFSGK